MESIAFVLYRPPNRVKKYTAQPSGRQSQRARTETLHFGDTQPLARDRMKKGFYTIMSAQFFSSLADNALVRRRSGIAPHCLGSAEWQRAALVPMFALFYVVLAPFVGAFADAVPKGKVMFISNLIKVFGCLMMLFGTHPLMSLRRSSAWVPPPIRRRSTAS